MRIAFFAAVMQLYFVGTIFAQAHITKEPVANDGTPVQLDLPKALHMRNTGGSDGPRGPGSGSGLCVFTSINHAAYWQNVFQLQEFQKWMTKYPGGGHPQKVDAMIGKLCKEQGLPMPDYLNMQTNDLNILRSAVRSGRMPSITYNFSPVGRYGKSRIYHMVSLVAAGAGKGPDGKGWWAVLDNNYPGTFEWMSEAQFMRVYAYGGTGWTVCLLRPSCPPVPFN